MKDSYNYRKGTIITSGYYDEGLRKWLWNATVYIYGGESKFYDCDSLRGIQRQCEVEIDFLMEQFEKPKARTNGLIKWLTV